MNTLQFYPKVFRQIYIQNIRNAGIEIPPTKYHNSVFLASLIITAVITTILFFFNVSMLWYPAIFVFVMMVFFTKVSLQASDRIRKMELIFPDVISLMASNLRSGITIDRAFLLAAKPEFDPLDKEILKTGKDITTGQDIIYALTRMSDRIKSEKISRVVTLLISGIKAGGNMADLLEQTSANMKKKEVLEKKSRSTILMYVIFIFVAVAAGAPALFSLSSVLVQIIIDLTARLPEAQTAQQTIAFSFSELSITVDFVIYFAVIFMIVSDFISSLVIGLVRKGNSMAGLRYFFPLVTISLGIFFILRAILENLLVDNLIPF